MSDEKNGPIFTREIVNKRGHVYGSTPAMEPEVDKLGPLQALIGRWASPDRSKNGYNVMPLPQINATEPGYGNNFILKNFYYYEEMDFGFIGRVPNRGGRFTQNCYGLLYEQRVAISDGPAAGKGIHAENGSWLNLVIEKQLVGPYGSGDPDQAGKEHLPVPPAPEFLPGQDKSRVIAKQVSVPHGNSLLALGTYEHIRGAPKIPDVSALPTGASQHIIDSYVTEEDRNPNAVLRKTLENDSHEIEKTVVMSVSTYNGGHIGNIPFMEAHANVVSFETTFWIEYFKSSGDGDGEIQLQYSQTINMTFPGVGGGIIFPHVTVNTLRRLPEHRRGN